MVDFFLASINWSCFATEGRGLDILLGIPIGLAYGILPLVILNLVSKRITVSFARWLLVFGALIAVVSTSIMTLACMPWQANYELAIILKLLATGLACFAVLKIALTASSEPLEAANSKLAEAIDGRERAEVSLRLGNAMFQAVFEGSASGVSLANIGGCPLAANPLLLQMLDCTESEFLAKDFAEYVGSDGSLGSSAGANELYQEMIAGHRDCYQIEKRFVRKDGQVRFGNLSVSLIRNSQGEPQFCLGMLEDITDRKQIEASLQQYQHILEVANQRLAQEIKERALVEKALRESEAGFRSIFEDAVIGIALRDMTGAIIRTNVAYQRMLDYSESELQQIPYTDLMHPDDLAIDSKLFQELVAGKLNFYQMEKIYLRKDGQSLWGHLTVSLVRDDDGKPRFYISMLNDITKRKQAEAALQKHQEQLEDMVGERTIELTRANEQLSWQASHDAMTGLVNRREFKRRLEETMANAKLYDEKHTLCFLDLDRFKVVNDTCGHAAGDELLLQVSTLFQAKCRKTDTLARLGGDEFGLLLYKCPLQSALSIVQELQDSIREFEFTWEDRAFYIGVSIGIVEISKDSSSLDSVLTAADTACYAAKYDGRDRFHVHQESIA